MVSIFIDVDRQGMLLEAIFSYNLGEEPELGDSLVSLAFGFFRRTFDRDWVKYEQRCRKNRENALFRFAKDVNAVIAQTVYERMRSLPIVIAIRWRVTSRHREG